MIPCYGMVILILGVVYGLFRLLAAGEARIDSDSSFGQWMLVVDDA